MIALLMTKKWARIFPRMRVSFFFNVLKFTMCQNTILHTLPPRLPIIYHWANIIIIHLYNREVVGDFQSIHWDPPVNQEGSPGQAPSHSPLQSAQDSSLGTLPLQKND